MKLFAVISLGMSLWVIIIGIYNQQAGPFWLGCLMFSISVMVMGFMAFEEDILDMLQSDNED
jgi:hypothetical protein